MSVKIGGRAGMVNHFHAVLIESAPDYPAKCMTPSAGSVSLCGAVSVGRRSPGACALHMADGSEGGSL